MRTLVFHTITQRDWDFSKSHRDPSQPPLLALVASLQDSEDGEIARMERMVLLDDGMQVDPSTTEREGLTTYMMETNGYPLDDVMAEFNELLDGMVEYGASYGAEHHWKVVQIAAESLGGALPFIALMCLMKKSTIPCRLPSRSPNTFKQPKLVEAYDFFAGRPLSLNFDGDAQSILRQHLDARLQVFHGLQRYEAEELKKAAGASSIWE